MNNPIKITVQTPQIAIAAQTPKIAIAAKAGLEIIQYGTLTVGETTTLEAGENATVSNSGTVENAVLNFGIPKGHDGTNGKDGLNGIDGNDGTAATITIGTVTTGEPGSNASVINVGTDTAAVFDIAIPRGDKGADWAGTGVATTEEAIAGVVDNKLMTPLKTKEAVAAHVPEIMQEALQNKADIVNGKVPTNQLPAMDYVPNSEVGNAANKIPKYNASGHLVLPNGAEFWIG